MACVFFSSRRRHTRYWRDWSSDVCSSDLIKYVLALVLAGGLITACDNDIENIEVQKPLTYSDQYYQNLRDYKASEHSIAFMWFAQYGAQNSMAVRFNGLPDSLDIRSEERRVGKE